MFERLTDQAHRVLVRADAEVRLLDHSFTAPEHLFLALSHRDFPVTSRALADLGLVHQGIYNQLAPMHGQNYGMSGSRPFSSAAEAALLESLDVSLRHGHTYIAPAHLLIGLMHPKALIAPNPRTGLGVLLRHFDVDPKAVTQRIIETAGPDLNPTPPATPEDAFRIPG